MAIKDEHLKMTVTVAGDEARKQILDLTKAIEDSKSSIREMNKEREMLARTQQTNSSRCSCEFAFNFVSLTNQQQL